MKKLISFLIITVLFAVISSCERVLEMPDETVYPTNIPTIIVPPPPPPPVVIPNTEAMIREFLSSSEFLKLEPYISNYGDIGRGIVQNMPFLKEDSKGLEGVILIPISRGNIPTACLQVIKVPEGNLPNKDIYFINLVDLRGVNTSTLTGEVNMIGLNYDFFRHTTMEIDNNVITSAKYFPLSSEYQEILAKGKLRDLLHCFRWAMHQVGDASLVFFYACLFPLTDLICIIPSALYCFKEVLINDSDSSIYY